MEKQRKICVRGLPGARLFFMVLFLFMSTIAGCGLDGGGDDSEEHAFLYPTTHWAEAEPEEVGMDGAGLKALEEYFSKHISSSLLV
ncbi:hypothetical protein ACFL4G_03300, partial [Thermodesulfobacteriota bacterium]